MGGSSKRMELHIFTGPASATPFRMIATLRELVATSPIGPVSTTPGHVTTYGHSAVLVRSSDCAETMRFCLDQPVQ